MSRANRAHRKNERGVTIVLVAVSLVALLGMAALAIDIATLYMAHGEAQRAADAAALAGAKMFAASGYTSAPTSLNPADICQTSGPGASAAANRLAEAVAAQNLIAGQPAAVQTITCDVTPANPQITVTIQRPGLPRFFGRIWGSAVNSVSATAVAEAYNASGSTAPIQVKSVKPWLIPNCDPTNGGAGYCTNGGGPGFVDNNTGAIQNNGLFVGKTITLTHVVGAAVPNVTTTVPRTLDYYRANVPINPPAPVCPSTSAVSCDQVGSDPYHDNIACASTFQFSCGQTIGAGQTVTVGGGSDVLTNEGTQCLIHAGGQGLAGQDELFPTGGTPNGTAPIRIKGGDNNPNPALQGVTSISRSDSIVTVPIYHGPGAGGPDLTTQTGTIVGFLQLGITENVAGGPNGQVKGVVMNVAGCNPGAGGTAVSGGGVSPIPVRLIHQ